LTYLKKTQITTKKKLKNRIDKIKKEEEGRIEKKKDKRKELHFT
jgi:hypothetical protein